MNHVNTNQQTNNQVELIGRIVSDYTFSHELFGEGFYTMNVEMERTSGIMDTLNCLISDRLADTSVNATGCRVKITGQFRSFNQPDKETGRSRLLLQVFVQEIEEIEETIERDKNAIELHGFLCKEPIYRTTPLGREITDFLIAVNRPYGKSDYIPCICWGRNARFASGLPIGEKVCIKGRIQSKEYYKRNANGKKEKTSRIAYEVSASCIKDVNDV